MFNPNDTNIIVYRLSILILLMILLTSCGHSTPQDVSRSTNSSDIVISSENTSAKTESQASTNNTIDTEPSETYDPDSWLSRVSDPVLYRDTPYKPIEYDFSISFKDNLLVVDYGRQTVSVYQARYDDIPESKVSGTWQLRMHSVPDVIDWCQGHHGPLSKDEVLNNFFNVRRISFSEIEGFDSIAEDLGIGMNNAALCWTYDTGDISGANGQIQYIPLSAQYIDGLPVRMDKNDGPVFEYSEGAELSRRTNWDPRKNWRGCYMDSNQTIFLYVSEERFVIENMISEDLKVYPAEDCLAEIKKAIIYNNFSHRKVATDPNKMELYTVWETDVVVYCMELAYMVLDPTPYEQYDDHLETHELTIAPVWVAYYTVTNSRTADENIVYGGTVMLNAVTGESIYSEMYGPEENDYLYPHAKDPG